MGPRAVPAGPCQQQQLELLQQQQLSAAVESVIESVQATGGRQCPGGFAIDLIVDILCVRRRVYKSQLGIVPEFGRFFFNHGHHW